MNSRYLISGHLSEALARVAQVWVGSLIPEDFQGQTGWDSEQTDGAVDVSAHSREVGLDGL